MKLCFILWTRPEIIKLYSTMRAAEKAGIEYFIIHTNQHYSRNMDAVFLEELGIKEAKYNLGINGWWHGNMTWRMLIEMEKILLDEKPDIVFIQWDTNTVLAGWLAATKIPGIKVAHIEAWLRSYDRTMPEEINRIVADHLSDYLFCPTESQKKIALEEWIDEAKIFVTGNTIVDIVYLISSQINWHEDEYLSNFGVKNWEYILFTTHRPSNVDDEKSLRNLLEWMESIRETSWKVILFPVHPRTRNNIEKFGLNSLIADFNVVEPVGFHETITLEKCAYLIATDSWGIQEEACILQKKTLVLRENTERPETVEVGWAILVGHDRAKMIAAYDILKDKAINWYNPFWDGKSGEKIIEITTSR